MQTFPTDSSVGSKGRCIEWLRTALVVSCMAVSADGLPTQGAESSPIGRAHESSTSSLGLPAPQRTSGVLNPAAAQLGQVLFFDPRLSRDGSTSCASCHQPEKYFSDGLATSRGVGGAAGSRNAPSLLNVAFVDSQFWDGRVQTLEQQALAPMLNPREMGMPSLVAVVDVVRADDGYRRLFDAVYGDGARHDIRVESIAQAITAYERSLVVGDSAFDRQVFGGRVGELSARAERGYRLFVGAAGCATCHLVSSDHATFTDNRFHSLGVGLHNVADRLAALTLQVAELRRQGQSVDQIVLAERDFAELGRFVVTLSPVDLGAFRTPSLRNVARTAPYMHDGSVATLAEAVDHEIYYRSNERGHPLLVTPDERQDLVEFLQSLTSPLDQVRAKAPPSARSSMPTDSARR